MSEKQHLAYGRHVLVDIYDAEPHILNNIEDLEHSLVSATINEGVTILGTVKKAFHPSGVTILLLLAESHVSLHTYPDQGRAFFDAFTCGIDYEPTNIFHSFATSILQGTYRITSVQRGDVEQMKVNCRV